MDVYIPLEWAQIIWDLKAALLVSCVKTWKSNVWGPNFTLQNSIWLILISRLLEVERMNESNGGIEIKNIYERLPMLIIYTVRFLSFFADEPDPRYTTYNFASSLEI